MYLPVEKISSFWSSNSEDTENEHLLEVIVASNSASSTSSTEDFCENSAIELPDIASSHRPTITLSLYEKVIACIDMLKEIEKNNPAPIKKAIQKQWFKKLIYLGVFNVYSTIAFPGALYGLLTTLDAYLSRDIIAKLNSLHHLLEINNDYLTTLYARLLQEFEYTYNNAGNSYAYIAKQYAFSLANYHGCREWMPKNFWMAYWEHEEERKRDWAILTPLGDVCSYFSEHAFTFPKAECNFDKDRLCFWVKQSEIDGVVTQFINSITEEINQTVHYIPRATILGLTITSAVLASLGLLYYGRSFAQLIAEYKEELFEIEQLDKIENCLKDPIKLNALLSISEKFQIKLMGRPIKEIIADLEKKAEVVAYRSACRHSFFHVCNAHYLPKEVAREILLYTDLVPHLSQTPHFSAEEQLDILLRSP